jgi:conjugative transposon TraN protein
MKKIIMGFFLSLVFASINAQKENYTVLTSNVLINNQNINTATIPLNATVHFVSPEPIEYVDISSPYVQGDLTEKNIFRLRPEAGKVHPGDQFIVTIVTRAYISVYKLTVAGPLDNNSTRTGEAYVISVNPNDGVQVNQSDVLNNQECFDLVVKAMNNNRGIHNIEARSFGIKMYVRNMYTFGDYIMIELAAKNRTNLQFNIDQVRFKIIDKKTVKATISQDIELKPVYSLYQNEGRIITDRFNNFYIFKKFTYPTQKLLDIEMTEKQYSGRKVDLKIKYNQVLNAHQLN